MNLLINTNVHCQSEELPVKASSCLLESTQDLLKFFYMEKTDYTVNTYCSALLYEISFALYTNLFDEIATLYSRLYCDLDKGMYDCLFESWQAV